MAIVETNQRCIVDRTFDFSRSRRPFFLPYLFRLLETEGAAGVGTLITLALGAFTVRAVSLVEAAGAARVAGVVNNREVSSRRSWLMEAFGLAFGLAFGWASVLLELELRGALTGAPVALTASDSFFATYKRTKR